MDVSLVVGIGLLLLVVLLLCECPVSYSLALSGGLGIFLMQDFGLAHSTLAATPYAATAQFSLVLIPLYILLGVFAVHAGISDAVYRFFAHILEKRVPGGLGIGTVFACAGFAAVSGSSIATSATMAKVAIPGMRKAGYSDRLASGIVAASGTLGVLIPPSILLVIFGVITRQSIGRLLLAGIVPGIVSAVVYMLYLVARGRGEARRRYESSPPEPPAAPGIARGGGAAAPTGPLQDAAGGQHAKTLGLTTTIEARTDSSEREDESTRPASWSVRIPGIGGVARAALLFFIVVVGIYTGFVTVTESGALGALAALVMLVVVQRRAGFRKLIGILLDSLREAAATTSMVMVIFVGAVIYTYFVTIARVPSMATAYITGLDVHPLAVVAIILLLFIPLGMILDPMSTLLIMLPVVHPIISALGMDAMWFAILAVKMIEIGLVTPPVGLNCFVVSASVPDMRVEQVFRGVAPFIALDIVTVAILFAFPGIVTWLPDLVAG